MNVEIVMIFIADRDHLNHGCILDIIKDAIVIDTQFPWCNPIWIELLPSFCFNRRIIGEMCCDTGQNDTLFMRPESGLGIS